LASNTTLYCEYSRQVVGLHERFFWVEELIDGLDLWVVARCASCTLFARAHACVEV
jgi:hypothetical protein